MIKYWKSENRKTSFFDLTDKLNLEKDGVGWVGGEGDGAVKIENSFSNSDLTGQWFEVCLIMLTIILVTDYRKEFGTYHWVVW